MIISGFRTIHKNQKPVCAISVLISCPRKKFMWKFCRSRYLFSVALVLKSNEVYSEIPFKVKTCIACRGMFIGQSSSNLGAFFSKKSQWHLALRNSQWGHFIKFLKLTGQFLIFKPLSYCFEETIGFDVKTSFASCPLSRLIR